MDHSPTVLLIEEDVRRVETLRRLLHEKGYHVYSARDGVRGLEMFDRLLPNIVILDMLLPEMSGFRVLEGIKSRDQLCRTIMVSSFDGGAQARFALCLGADAFLHRPVPHARLLECVTQLCPPPAAALREPAGAPHLLDATVGVHGKS